MAKVKCKGTVLQQEISSVFTAVAQVISIDIGETKTETWDSTSLDTSGAGKTKGQTGYAEPGDVSFEIFFDPALAGHQAITDLVTTPAENNWKVIFADTGSTELPFASAGVGFGATVDMGDGLKASVSLETTGLPTYAT